MWPTQQPYEHDEQNGGEGKCLSGVVDPGHSVHKAPHQEERHSKQTASENYVPHPVMAAYLLEHIGRDISGHARGEGIQENGSGVHGVMSMDIEHPQESHDNDGYGKSQKLTAITCTQKTRWSLDT